MTWNVFLFILGLSLLFFGGDFLILSVKKLSKRFNVKPIFLSIFLLGVGTSAPEWFVTVTSSVQNFSDLALGNVVGSNISNIGLILGFFGLFNIAPVSKSLIKFDFPVLFLSFGLTILFSIGGFISRLESFFLLLVFVIYIFYSIKNRKTEGEVPIENGKDGSLVSLILLVVVGFAFLFAGSQITIKSVIAIGDALRLSERFIGIFILSLGTSLPELAVSLQALFRKQEELALGNIVGSNIFNTFFVLGSAGLISTLEVSSSFLKLDYWVMLGLALVIWGALLIFKRVPKIVSIFVLLSYSIYIGFLFL